MSAPARPAPGSRFLAWAAAGTPLTVSLAANVTWGWQTGSPVLIVAGVATPLLLVLAIERWRAMPPAVGVEWRVRTAAMSGVVVVVAGWSWLHMTALLLAEVQRAHAGEPPAIGIDRVLRAVEVLLCLVAALAVDGLAVLSVLALRHVRRDGAGRTGVPPGHGLGQGVDAPSNGDETAQSATATVISIVGKAPAGGLTRAEIRDLAMEAGVSRSSAYKAVTDLVAAARLRNISSNATASYVLTGLDETSSETPHETSGETSGGTGSSSPPDPARLEEAAA